jgi:alkaline phosphatase D
VRLAIASCCKLWQDPENHAWSALVQERPRPDWLVLLGDNVYLKKRKERKLARGTADARAVLEPEYQRLVREPSFSELVKQTKLLATWDDHDFGGDDLNGAEEPYIGFRDAARAVMLQYLAGAGGPRTEIYTAVSPAPDVRLILTDARYYRTDPSSPSATLLGTVQEEWLLGELARPERVKIVASGSCLGPKARKNYRQGWENYPAWMERFRDAITRGHAAGHRHLFVAGDVHRNKIIEHTRTALDAPIVEVISSGACRKKRNWNPFSKPLQNYGLLDFRSEAVDIRLCGNRKRDRRTAALDVESWLLD